MKLFGRLGVNKPRCFWRKHWQMGSKHYNLMPCCKISQKNYDFISFFCVLVEKFVKCGQNITIWCPVAINPEKKYVFISLLTLSLPLALCRYTISIAINKAMMSLILVGIDKKWKARPLAFQKCQSQCSEFQRSRANWRQMNVLSKILECSTEKITRKKFFFSKFLNFVFSLTMASRNLYDTILASHKSNLSFYLFSGVICLQHNLADIL